MWVVINSVADVDKMCDFIFKLKGLFLDDISVIFIWTVQFVYNK